MPQSCRTSDTSCCKQLECGGTGGKGAAVCHSAADSILLASAVLLSAASDWTGLHAADLEPSMHLSTVGIVCLVLDRVVDLLLYDCRFFSDSRLYQFTDFTVLQSSLLHRALTFHITVTVALLCFVTL